MRLFPLIPGLFVGLAALSGCSETIDTTARAQVSQASNPILTSVNTTCPIMGGTVTAEGGSVEFDGREVGFCCRGCIDKWNQLSADEETAQLAAAGSDEADGDKDQPDHDPGDTSATS